VESFAAALPTTDDSILRFTLTVDAFLETASELREQPQCSIENIVNALERKGFFSRPTDDTDIVSMKRNLVFVFIDWLTFLYKPKLDQCREPIFRISQDMPGDEDQYLSH
jgi:hypothetical protein